MAQGATIQEIVADYPYLEADDVRASLAYAAAEAGEPVILTA